MNEAVSLFTIQPTQHVYGGSALGRLPDGRVVFTPFALPGETIKIRVIEEKRNYCRAELVEVAERSLERVDPRCQHFGRCGGCHYQHLPYHAQLKIKKAILSEQIERIAGIKNPPILDCVPATEPFHYRNYNQFHLTSDGALGYIEQDGLTVFPIIECHLPVAQITELWPQLDFVAVPEIKRVGIRSGEDADLQIILESDDVAAPEITIEDLPVSVSHLSPAGTLVLVGSQKVRMQILGRDFYVSAESFFQVNSAMAALMIEHLLANLDLQPGMTILDVYCGAGLFSAFLAPHCRRLIGIEASRSSCSDFVENLDEFENVELFEALAEDVLPYLQNKIDLIIVDPPRAGIDRRAMDGLIKLGAPVLAYISCDPATLARDAKRLTHGGYKLLKIIPFDLFPQTFHIESISYWHKVV